MLVLKSTDLLYKRLLNFYFSHFADDVNIKIVHGYYLVTSGNFLKKKVAILGSIYFIVFKFYGQYLLVFLILNSKILINQHLRKIIIN